MVGKKSRSVYRKKRKKSFSGRRKQNKSLKKQLPMLTKSPPQLRALRWMKISSLTRTLKKPLVPPERKWNMPLLLDSSDEECTFNTEESEGFRLINEKNLSTAVSKAHVCEKGEKFFSISVFLCSRLWLISHIISTLSSSFSLLNTLIYLLNLGLGKRKIFRYCAYTL